MKRLLSVSLVMSLLIPVPYGESESAAIPGCKAVVHMGDSLSLSIQKSIIPLYNKMGFKNVFVQAVNGGSIWYPQGLSGLDAVNKYKAKYGSGVCWVIALGTNDSASTAYKNWSPRIESIMTTIGNDPVVWINVWFWSKSRPSYNLFVATAWNSLLFQYQKKYLNMRILDWATIAKSHPEWFTSDGLHYNQVGMSNRELWISLAAGILFPYTPR